MGSFLCKQYFGKTNHSIIYLTTNIILHYIIFCNIINLSSRAAYCDQYLSDETGRCIYGFGAAANVVCYLPFLRNIMGWLTAGSADYKVLKDGLVHGISPSANLVGRKPRHLFILPGGVAEVYTSTIGRNCIVLKERRGLVRLSIETRAKIIPGYVFGGTDFYHNLATSGSSLSTISRKLKAGITWFWGQFGLPIPFTPKVTLVIGK